MRLDIERQRRKEPKRFEFARKALEALGFKVVSYRHHLTFTYKNENVMFYPYSGWHSGKSITDGRGVYKLLKQLTKKQ